MMRVVTPRLPRKNWVRWILIAVGAIVLGGIFGALSVIPAAALYRFYGVHDPWHAAKLGMPGGVFMVTLFWAFLLWKYSRKPN